MILKLIGMLILGMLSAVLSYYRKNYYVRVFDDILGKDEEERMPPRLGRGFVYGFFFPVYFSLAIAGLVALISFLIVAGIIAGIVFVIVWATEKIIPNEAIGNIVFKIFSQIGLKAASNAASAVPPSAVPPPLSTSPGAPSSQEPGADAGVSAPQGESQSGNGSADQKGINVTRHHSLD
jgi:F0F1-type ATP synthase assembly protein I